MPKSSPESLRELLDGIESISDARLEKLLAQAAFAVSADGVNVDHEAFEYLQEYYAAGLLERSGGITGVLASQSVGDVSESYASGSSESIDSWFGLYQKTLRRITGKAGFIV